ncbi:ABC transporter permease [Occultella glacieicola]|uniref:ABC transporter permease n=1 Tax=Occultella glacieicola TaxID=2518684 RepID=A0ABY2E7E6_9MICO|nr:ABC transporter permease [Occultella glacieicola]TDE97483.1 ABC transporter permease [Occultella glacieicola]
MTTSDLRQRIRDKSVIIFSLIVPLALMFVFNLVFGGTDEIELEPVTVAVSAPADDEVAGTLVEAITGTGVIDVTVEQMSAGTARTAVADGEVNLAMIVPDGFGQDVLSGTGGALEFVEGDTSGLETGVVIVVSQSVLDAYAAGTVAATAGGGLGLNPEELGRVAQEAATAGPTIDTVAGQTSDEQLGPGASLVAGQAGLFLTFTVGFGVLGLIAERQEGTLARLQSMPMRPGLIVLAKALTGFILGVVATSVLLTLGGLFFDVSFGPLALVGLLILSVVTAITSLTFIVVRLARTAEQAGIIQSILAMVLGISGGAFFPVSASGALARVLDLNPIAAFTRGLGITSGGGGLADLAAPIAIMLGFAVVMLVVARLIPDRGVSR